ncbi:MAG: M28 family peptidase [Thermoleophilaceae bacterium]|nr:M28 family peptidase [Thermoleophilaceae bacterium]
MPLLTEPELRERITRLAAIDRPSASPGERHAAELIVSELRELGIDARIEEERVHGTYWWPLGIPTAVAALAGLGRSRLRAGLVGLTAAAAVADDLRIGPRVLRRVLPKRTTANVVGELGPPDAPRTVLLTSHHDAAHSGLVFHPELPRAVARRLPRLLERTNTTPPTLWAAFGGPLLVGLGALLGARRTRRIGAGVSAGNTLALLDIGLRGAVPGANDNLSGVAALLSVARALQADPVDGVRVILLSTGSEESFMEGMEAFARRHFDSLSRERTHVICLDTVGSPHLLLLEGEGMLGVREYSKDFLRLVHECADELGVFLWPNLRFRNATDGLTALRFGFPAAMIGSVDRYRFPTNYHWPTDTPENVHYRSVSDAARVCRAVIERLGR